MLCYKFPTCTVLTRKINYIILNGGVRPGRSPQLRGRHLARKHSIRSSKRGVSASDPVAVAVSTTGWETHGHGFDPHYFNFIFFYYLFFFL